MLTRILGAVPLLVMLATPARAADTLAAVRRIPIQDGGRVKPLDTFARETARTVTGTERWQGEDPVAWLLSIVFEPARWWDAPIIRVGNAALKERLGLARDKGRFAYRDLAARQALWDLVREAQAKSERHDTLDPAEQEAQAVAGRINLLSGLFLVAGGEGDTGGTGVPLWALRIIPHADDPEGAWGSPSHAEEMYGKEAATGALQALAEVGLAYVHRSGGLAEAGETLRARLAALPRAPGILPTASAIEREVGYNRVKPFRIAWGLYLLAVVVLALSFTVGAGPADGGVSARGGARWLVRAGYAVFMAGFAFHSYGFTLRCLIAGRPPVSNMYESVIWVAWGAAAFALVFEAIYRARYFVVSAGVLGVLALVLADSLPNVLDPGIHPLEPVLRSQYWLTIHVLTITLSYAAFLLALGVGHVTLGYHLWAPDRGERITALTQFIYRVLQIGVLLLTAGTILGGVWANESCGRFWGWDPKETWALIALLGYLVILHGRFAGWVKDFGVAVGSVVAFLGVIMAWYGVNFVLGKGLHSYGFGAGGVQYVLAAVLADLGFVAFVIWSRRGGRVGAGATAGGGVAPPLRERPPLPR